MEHSPVHRESNNTDCNSRREGDRSTARSLVRLVLYFGITLLHVVRASLRKLIRRSAGPATKERDNRILQRWARHLNRARGLEVTVRGAAPEDGVLLVSNHRSYMDITAIGELAPVTFLAKHEVSRWPVLGYGCRLVDVVFVDRESADSRRRSRDGVANRLWRGISIVVFPEGTSYEGPGLLTFKPGIFQVAAQNRFPVMPVAISYNDPDDAWVGDDTFLRHFMQTFSKRRIPVTVHFGPIMKGDDPIRLMKMSWKWVRSALEPEGEYGKVS
jgi:1-acyl-sn-glycerol-3-phosphate acyltransferase